MTLLPDTLASDIPASAAGAYDPHGAALLDCFRGDVGAMLVCYQDGVRDDVPASWLRETMDPLEALGLDHCRGRVLDESTSARS